MLSSKMTCITSTPRGDLAEQHRVRRRVRLRSGSGQGSRSIRFDDLQAGRLRSADVRHQPDEPRCLDGQLDLALVEGAVAGTLAGEQLPLLRAELLQRRQ